MEHPKLLIYLLTKLTSATTWQDLLPIRQINKESCSHLLKALASINTTKNRAEDKINLFFNDNVDLSASELETKKSLVKLEHWMFIAITIRSKKSVLLLLHLYRALNQTPRWGCSDI